MNEVNQAFVVTCSNCGRTANLHQHESSIEANENKDIVVWATTDETVRVSCKCGNTVTF